MNLGFESKCLKFGFFLICAWVRPFSLSIFNTTCISLDPIHIIAACLWQNGFKIWANRVRSLVLVDKPGLEKMVFQ